MTARKATDKLVSLRKVLISPPFGAGWSTWIGETQEQKEFALFDEALIAAVERGGDGLPDALADFERRFREQFGTEPYLGGARGLTVEVIEGAFQVDEYDGSETVRLREREDWFGD